MAKNERQKRSARKARQAERAEHEAVVVENAVAQGKDPEKLAAEAARVEARKAEEKDKNPGLFKRIANWFRDVIREMKRVVWPTPRELRNYSFAVIGLLIFFGVVVWIVDTGVVAGLVQFSKIGPNAAEETELVETVPVEDGETEATDEASEDAVVEGGDDGEAASEDEAAEEAEDATAEDATADEAAEDAEAEE